MLVEESSFGQLSWILESDCVRMAVTKTGAHMAPVSFHFNDREPVLPYHISPWQGEDTSRLNGSSEAILRGDFFCLPFGQKDKESGEGPGHGRTASEMWEFIDSQSQHGISRLRVMMADVLGRAKVTREFFLRSGEHVIYDLTSISGLEGLFPLGHHAVLRTPDQENSMLVSTGELRYAMTFPGKFAEQEVGGRQSLAVGAEFAALTNVPSYDRKESLDCSKFPARPGCSDLIQVAASAKRGEPAWTAAVNIEDGYLWFSLRDPVLLPCTIFWVENCARQSFPWNGRNCSLGLEDVCSYFDFGTSASREPNEFSRRGVPTTQAFHPRETFKVPYIQGVVRVPPGFGYVERVICDRLSATFLDRNGLSVSTSVRTGFLYGEGFSNDTPSGHLRIGSIWRQQSQVITSKIGGMYE